MLPGHFDSPLGVNTFGEAAAQLASDWDKHKWKIFGVLAFSYFVWPMMIGGSAARSYRPSDRTYFRV